MLDVGRELAEAIYFLQYTLAQILWAVDRAALAIAVIAEDVNTWITENIGYFVTLITNALAGPMGALFIFALTLLGVWYLMNNILPTKRVVDPQKLLVYGFMTFFCFATPTLAIDLVEGLRQSATAGVQQSLIDDAAGDLFSDDLDGTDLGLPEAIPDVYPAGDGVVGSFDLVAAFLALGNLDELDSTEFPVLFAATYFPLGDPSSIDLTDEADRETAKALAADGLERLLFALIAIPTVIADHVLRLSLTGAAMLLYAGIPFAMMLAFFVYTEAFIGAYLRQFINLFIETFLSVIIASIMVGLLAVTAQEGIGLYIGASLITFTVLLWRIQGAFRLAASNLHLFGGGVLTGGANGRDFLRLGQTAVTGGIGVGLAALGGGSALAAAGLLRADAQVGGVFTDPEKAEGRVTQLQALAGYAVGQARSGRHLIETAHEVRTFSRNFRDGDTQAHEPDVLDYVRVGASMSGFGSSPWVAMRLSPSLRDAYGEIGGYEGWGSRPARSPYRDDGGAPVAASRRGTHDWDEETPPSPELASPVPNQPDMSNDRPQPGAWRSVVRESLEAREGQADMSSPAPQPSPSQHRSPAVRHASASSAGDRQPGNDAAAAATTEHETAVPTIRLAVLDGTRQAGLAQLADNLSGPAQAQTQQVLVTLVGAENAAQLQTAVDTHGAEAVQAAVEAIVDLVRQALAAGQTPAQVLTSFQDGRAWTSLPESPLNQSQLTAAADAVLLPRRELTPAELVGAMAGMVAQGGQSDQDLAAAVGSLAHFGAETGAVRAVLHGVERLQLTAAELQRLSGLLQRGGDPGRYLVEQGHAPAHVQMFTQDLAGLAGTLSVPQTTRPQAGGGETNEG